jgi:lysyl oxidase
MYYRMVRLFQMGTCVTIVCLSIASEAASQELRPNLRALPPSELQIVANASTGNPELRLTATSWNSGQGPLELIPGATGQAGQDVYQRVYTQSGGSTDYLAGTFVFHVAHNHFHFEQYAVYILKPVDAPGASQRQSYKTSFCIMDTSKIDAHLPGAPKRAVYSICNRDVQGMSIGWGDSYRWYLEGQAIDLTGNPDGLYELTVTFDPENRLLETNDADNSACLLLSISVVNRTVQTVGACGATAGGITISSVTPNSILVGTVVDVTIKGSNFTPGIAVGFENGAGPTPVASNVTVLDSNTIVATVSVKRNGGRSDDPIWDVRVGPTVFSNGFEVIR